MTTALGRVRHAVTPMLRRWEAVPTGLRAWDFPRWDSTIDQALATLPQLPACGHELYRALAEPRGDVTKKTVLVCDRDTPAAVVALRLADSRWEPVTTWITPGPPFPIAGGDLRRVLHAVGLPMTVAWWRCEVDPPRSRRVVPGPPEPTYRLPRDVDRESLWRETGLLKDVRRARRKCESFEARVDLPEGAEWVIRNWGRKWRVAQHRVEDMVVAARMRGALGLYHNTVFYDGDRPIGGHTEVVDGSDVVGQAVYRDSDYDRYSLGTWMFDRLAFWAVDAGYEGLDFGGTGEYKSRWARVGGRKFVIQVTPVHERMIASLQAALRTPRRRGTSSVGRAPRTMTSDARSH